MRHAERDNGSLSEAGLERADELAHVVLKAGVTAIYTTDTERARLTAQPLADLLDLDPLIYQVGSPEQIEGLAADVRRKQRGKVVLIVSHNPTVPQIIDALGGDSTQCSVGDAYNEFDDLCLVILHGFGAVEVLNLQYGTSSPQDSARRTKLAPGPQDTERLRMVQVGESDARMKRKAPVS